MATQKLSVGIHQQPLGFADASLCVRLPLREQGMLQNGSNELDY
jgi:hypothetical protein